MITWNSKERKSSGCVFRKKSFLYHKLQFGIRLLGLRGDLSTIWECGQSELQIQKHGQMITDTAVIGWTTEGAEWHVTTEGLVFL